MLTNSAPRQWVHRDDLASGGIDDNPGVGTHEDLEWPALLIRSCNHLLRVS